MKFYNIVHGSVNLKKKEDTLMIKENKTLQEEIETKELIREIIFLLLSLNDSSFELAEKELETMGFSEQMSKHMSLLFEMCRERRKSIVKEER